MRLLATGSVQFMDVLVIDRGGRLMWERHTDCLGCLNPASLNGRLGSQSSLSCRFRSIWPFRAHVCRSMALDGVS
jgi:hypothetical protein